jgi:isoleucyl-tRNA synthetase
MLRNLKEFNLPEIEEKVLAFWKTNSIFEKSVAIRKGRPRFVFYEGPPYANGRPGIHHVLARVFKDIIPRYKAMRGFSVPRRGGWDTHGLPVEIQVEKLLGIKNKREIEKFGVELFNQKAKEAVWQYKDEWERLTERIGLWLDLKNAYVTYSPKYIETAWWIFNQIAKRGFLKKNYKIVPYCPRCQTPLASHELGMPDVYKKVPDPSVYVKFKLVSGIKRQVSGNEYLLVWTTTPWTLPSNVAVAVDPKLTYTKFSVRYENGKKEYLWSYGPPPEIPGVTMEVSEKRSGQKLVGLAYEPLFHALHKVNLSHSYEVLAGDFVSTEEGTGMVHIAPAFGEEDLELIKKSEGKKFNWRSVPVTVDDAGNVMGGFPGAGKFIKEADPDIIADLEKRGLMYLAGKIEHEYPFCWRCGTALIYFARLSWFFEVSRIRKELLAANSKVNWIPQHIKEGRFGEWLKEAKDWAISRDRYWGTPLPIWECGKCQAMTVAGSLGDLDRHAYHKNKFILVRHGEATANVEGIVASGPEKGDHVSTLTEKGKKQAEKAAKALKKEKASILYSSPYKRTRETAEIIAQATGAKVIVDERLGELNCGIFNWQAVHEHKKFFGSPLEEFSKTPPEGENLSDLKRRVLNFLLEINEKHSGAVIAIIGHQDPLWMLETATRGASNEEAMKLSTLSPGEYKKIDVHNYPLSPNGEIDIHRPFVDRIVLQCPKCGEKMHRTREVADVWFDSGAMPYAQDHFPFNALPKGKSASHISESDIKKAMKNLPFPADYISEGIDQTRGWFYTLLTLSVLLGFGPSYKNVICLGLILDKNGMKMSKSKGNIVDPWEVIGKYGVDSVRWYFFTVNPPGEPKLFDENEVQKTMRRIILLTYNSYLFYDTYAAKRANLPVGRQVANRSTHVLDQWILSRLAATTERATDKLEAYAVGDAAKEIEALVDDLSRWYIRRSRSRFQRPVSAADHEAATRTLKTVLLELSRLMAPFLPFFSEALYQSMRKAKSEKRKVISVHLEDWPRAEKTDQKILKDMEWIRQMATAALAERAKAGIKVRQPLQKLSVKTEKGKPLAVSNELLEILKDEINVKEIVSDSSLEKDIKLDTVITAELREEGTVRELKRLVQELRQKSGVKPGDPVTLYIEAPSLVAALEKHMKSFKSDVGAKSIEFKRTEKFDAELVMEIEGASIWIGLKKN